jgi:hypothetical protein
LHAAVPEAERTYGAAVMGTPDYHNLKDYNDYSGFGSSEKEYWFGSYCSNSNGRLSGARVAAKGIRRVPPKVPHRRSQRNFRVHASETNKREARGQPWSDLSSDHWHSFREENAVVRFISRS